MEMLVGEAESSPGRAAASVVAALLGQLGRRHAAAAPGLNSAAGVVRAIPIQDSALISPPAKLHPIFAAPWAQPCSSSGWRSTAAAPRCGRLSPCRPSLLRWVSRPV